MRLETLLADLEKEYTVPWLPQKKHIPPLGYDLERKVEKTAAAITMGKFYEALASFLFGGHYDKKHVSLLRGETKPDLVSPQRYQEVKSARYGDSCDIMDSQAEAYKSLQLASEKSIDFVFFRHTFPGIKSRWNGPVKELIPRLMQETRYALTLPFPLILAMWDTKYFYRYCFYHYAREELFDSCHCLRSTTFNRLMLEPEQVITSLGENLTDYNIEKRLSPPVFYRRKRLDSFPLLVITHNNYGRWLERWKADHSEEIVPF